MLHNHPNIINVPQSLKNNELSPNQKTKFSRFGYEIEMPWDKIQRIDDYEIVTRIVFSPDFVVVVFNPAKNIGALDAVKSVVKKPSEMESLVQIFGANTMQSNYSYIKAELEITPNQFSVFKPRQYAIRTFTLLLTKSAQLMTSKVGSIWNISNKTMKGFQVGDPAQDQLIDIRMFDQNDKQYEIYTIIRTGANFKVSQSDINVIIQSLHVTSDSNQPMQK